MAKIRPIGAVQKSCLKAMVNYSQNGIWSQYGGWHWTTPSATLKIMKSLERRGLVEDITKDDYNPTYQITAAGRKKFK